MEKRYVVIIGGKLQGVEALYLAEKAGLETILVDKNPFPIGQKFCNRFICQDVIDYTRDLLSLFQNAAFVLPALEDQETLRTLKSLSEVHGFTLIYDDDAYRISSSKLHSDQAMARYQVPVPLYYPKGTFPYVAKPSGGSCSQGVQRINDAASMAVFLKSHSQDQWVIQEFLEGPSYSIEIIGTPGHYDTYHITELFMDEEYDCKRVLSRPDLKKSLKNRFQTIALQLGKMVQLKGIMDVEVIDHGGELKVLEIDARIPSQTPITVYHATGINMMMELYRKFYDPSILVKPLAKERYVSLEQVEVNGNNIKVSGEHIMTQSEPLSSQEGFCGADEALTDYEPGVHCWRATLIHCADSAAALEKKRAQTFDAICALQGGNTNVIDLEPVS